MGALAWLQLERADARAWLVLPRIESHGRYTAPVSYDDSVRIGLRVQELGCKVVTIGWTMHRLRDGRAVADGYVKFAVIQPQPGDEGDPRAIEVPPLVVQLFGPATAAVREG